MLKRWYGLFACLTALWLANVGRAEDWPQFRGPGSSAAAEKILLPDVWSAEKNILWQADVSGHGWSSPVVWGDRVFVTAVINDKTPKPRKGLYVQDLQGKIPPGESRWMVYALDLHSGKMLWQREVKRGEAAAAVHLKNTYASETPATDGERLYVYFGNVGVWCFDLAGNPLWTHPLGPFKTRMGWGTGASPIVYKGRVYLVHDNEEKSFLLALDGKTGSELWKTDRDEKSNWATPFVWENSLRTEIVTPGSGRVRSYDLEGKLLWELRGMSSVTIPTPSAAHDLLYVSSGYVVDVQKPVYAIRPGGSGDISLGFTESSNKHIAWCIRLGAPYHPSPLVYRDHVYVLYDRGFLFCYDAKTGKDVYARQRLDPGSDKFTASPVAADGKIYCLSEDGEVFVIRAGAKFELLAKNSLDEMALATPALVRGSMLLRTASKLYRIGNP